MEKGTLRVNCTVTISKHWFVILTFACFYLMAELGRISFVRDSPRMSSVSDKRPGFQGVTDDKEKESDCCSGRYIYMYRLPSKFNDDLLRDCRTLSKWFNMCQFIVNSGLGPRQFTLEVIFRSRMEHYDCLTNDSSRAYAVFVPFYAGLEVGRYLWGYNVSVRDSLENDLVEWLKKAPEWRKTQGSEHFLIGWRIGWDFRRPSDHDDEWGGKLLTVPDRNMTMLTIESTFFDNEVAIPYPTYFHPTMLAKVTQWQNKMRLRKRTHLFSFVGGPHNDSVRTKLMNECRDSGKRCQFFDCHNRNCDNPSRVLEVHENSVFCLQPPVDSNTRRSTFDSILTGCIPVFFRWNSAYTQYFWHLPRDYNKCSIFINEDDIKQNNISVAETLLRIPAETVKAMREEVIKLIPRIIYADPRSEIKWGMEDVFDVAVNGVLNRIKQVKMELPTFPSE